MSGTAGGEGFMESASGMPPNRQFEVFVTGATDVLFRAAYLMTGNASDAEDLVQETYIRVARRWNRVRSMDQPVAYGRTARCAIWPSRRSGFLRPR
jgi:DNA-directed RNA polymerase specialized sigma24 family protein